jgi:hypothetical protein
MPPASSEYGDTAGPATATWSCPTGWKKSPESQGGQDSSPLWRGNSGYFKRKESLTMQEERNIQIFLHDMIENIERVERFTLNITFEEFRNDEKTYFATLQCIEIIGEAAKHDRSS